MTERKFKKLVWDYYKKSGRHALPWRNTRDPYRILVSEVMLQQTQVPRVLRKYEEFMVAFPTVEDLAKAPTGKLLKAWQGLGYNRRALNLKRAAECILSDFNGKFPSTKEELESLPGVGPSTSGGILAYAFDIPSVFIETNIRSVFIHHFFKSKRKVRDTEIATLVEETLDRDNPREWYYALMDYGVHLKQTLPNPSRRSKHHVRQSAFKGSNRELRSKIITRLLKEPLSVKDLEKHIGKTPFSIGKNIRDLVQEGFIKKDGNLLYISG